MAWFVCPRLCRAREPTAQGFSGKQSAADGACPLMLASFAVDANSGDFFMPGDLRHGLSVGTPVKCMEGGRPAPKAEWQAQKFENERLTMSAENRRVLLEASREAVAPHGTARAKL